MSSCRKQLTLTIGEPSGINGEIICKTWARKLKGLVPFFVIGDPDYFLIANHQYAREVTTQVEVISRVNEGCCAFIYGLPVFSERLPGKSLHRYPNPVNINAILTSIRRAVSYVKSHQAAAIITSPIHKKTLYEAGFPYLGHTEFMSTFSEKDAERENNLLSHPVMMLMCKNLRVVPITTHLSLSQAIASLQTNNIIVCGQIVVHYLQKDFGIIEPRLAVAALNPHSGEDGTMGNEEQTIISPAVKTLKKYGIHVFGPVPADTLFHKKARDTYDAVLCMYHDQALIPLKTLGFSDGINITLGLRFIRTSPDHGTGFDISGYNFADESSLIQALNVAQSIAIQHLTNTHYDPSKYWC